MFEGEKGKNKTGAKFSCIHYVLLSTQWGRTDAQALWHTHRVPWWTFTNPWKLRTGPSALESPLKTKGRTSMHDKSPDFAPDPPPPYAISPNLVWQLSMHCDLLTQKSIGHILDSWGACVWSFMMIDVKRRQLWDWTILPSKASTDGQTDGRMDRVNPLYLPQRISIPS